MSHNVLDGHAIEVVNLTTAQDRWQQLMLLCRSENENHIVRRFLQCLQEGIERLIRQHVHLVDDKHLIFTYLRRNARLFNQVSYIFYRIIRSRIQLIDIQRTLLVESHTRLTNTTSLTIVGRRHTVDNLRKDAGTSGLAYPTRSAKQISMRKMSRLNRLLQRRSQGTLPHYRVERHRTILAC